MVRFTTPYALLFLLLLPALAALGWPGRGGWRGNREKIALGLRLAIALCLVLALAGLELVRASRQLAVVFLIDGSASMSPVAQAAAAAWVRTALEDIPPDDQAAVIVFGGDALVERGMSPGQGLGPLTSVPIASATDLSAAIRLGLALLPPDAARRMVILSDGIDTVHPESLPAAALLAQASGVQIEVVPFSSPPGPEALLANVDAPTRLHQGERFDLRVEIQATQSLTATLRVIAGGQVVYQALQPLERGSQSFSLPLTAGAPGFTRYQVQLEPAQDGYFQNNALSAYTQVSGPPQVLVVAPPPGEPLPGAQGQTRPDEAAQLVAALRAANLEVAETRPSSLPSAPVELAQYASIVLVDVPATSLDLHQMAALQAYVRDAGGGLVAVGGPTSFGMGGYYKTPLEEILPVSMQIKDQQRHPTLTMVFILDHSGSMAETSGGVTKLDLAKEAALRSVDLLFPSDRVGVIAFDDSASWVVPITGLDDPAAIKNAIASIRAGGGTDILAGLQAAARALPEDPSSVKHIILLTDGGADPTGIPELVRQMHDENGITLTTVGIGRDAAPFLPGLAEIGAGRYHFAPDPSAIPSIFAQETTLVSRAYLVEHSFYPTLQTPSPIVAGIEATPPLLGYVATSPKPAAQTILLSDEQDPVLAAWQYGLGRTVAFTSDASSRWAQAWVDWPVFPTFWGQVVDYTLRQASLSPVEVRVEAGSETAQLVVDARTEEGAFLDRYAVHARVISPDGSASDVALKQVAPGRYEAAFTPQKQGAYLITVNGQPPAGAENLPPFNEASGWVQPYSPEYRTLKADPQQLLSLAATTGGTAVTSSPAVVFSHTLPASRATRPIWPWLLALAAFLLPLDIAVRRLALTPTEMWRGLGRSAQKTFARLEAVLSGSRTARTGRASRLEALFDAKQRAAPRDEPPDFAPPSASPSVALGRAHTPLENPSSEPVETPPATQAPPEPQAQSSTPASTTASLLESKRRRNKNQE